MTTEESAGTHSVVEPNVNDGLGLLTTPTLDAGNCQRGMTMDVEICDTCGIQ